MTSAILVALAGTAITGALAAGFRTTGETAVAELFVETSARTSGELASGTVNLKILLQALVSSNQGAGPSDSVDVRRLVGRAVTGGARGNLMPGAESVAILVQRPGTPPEVAHTQTLGLSRGLLGARVQAGGTLDEALLRTRRDGLTELVDAEELAGADLALVAAAADDGQAPRWVVILLDRATMLERSLRGTGLEVTIRDVTPGRTAAETASPVVVRDPEARAATLVDADARTELVTFADRTWELEYRQLSTLADKVPQPPVRVVFFGGLSISLLLALVLWSLGNQRAHALRQVRETTATLEERELQFRSLAAASPVGIVYTDSAGAVHYANRRMLQLLGVGGEGDVIGRELASFLRPTDAARLRATLGTVDAGMDGERFLRGQLDRPAHTIVQMRLAVVGDVARDRRGWAVSVEDVTAEVERQEELRREESRHRQLAREFAHQAAHDPLTGLPNRSQLVARLEHGLPSARPGTVALLFIDLDGFKVVNDGLGHAAGDLLLRAVAHRLQTAVRDSDLAARLGGDEFAVLLEATDSPEEVEHLAQRLLQTLDRPFRIDDQSVTVGASCGIATNWPGATPSDLLRNADLAMYAAKRGTGAAVRWYEPSMHRRMRERHDLERDLRQAIAAGEISCALQPIVDLRTGHAVGAEALARWTSPARGVVPPGVFVPIAEETGLIVPIGAHVLQMVCELASTWPDRRLGLSVNTTVGELEQPGFVDTTLRTLREFAIAPDRLTIELTESDVMTHDSTVPARLAALREHGVRVAIDDFGTGHSSLGKLRTLPIDVLKLDRSFVTGIERGPREQAFVEAIVHLAATLDLDLVAEGVETEAELRTLRGVGCELAQGYHLGRPVAREDLAGRPPEPTLLVSPSRS